MPDFIVEPHRFTSPLREIYGSIPFAILGLSKDIRGIPADNEAALCFWRKGGA
jgi:hypothetical protein